MALVNGTGSDGDNRPVVEWHSVNWTARRYGQDRTDVAPEEPLGLYPFQLVGFKERVGAALFQGPTSREDFVDTRFADRLIKFPSGELPAAFAEVARFGGSLQGDGRDLNGRIDEVVVLQHRAADLILDQPMAETDTQFVVRTDLLLTGFGPIVVGGDVTERYPGTGGLLSIDGEILAFTEHSGGTFTIAPNGRGLLHTIERAHDEGARVRFLTHVPAAILTDGVTDRSDRLQVESLGLLPRFGGTLLLGRTELLHYTWTRANNVLEMPRYFDQERGGSQGRGLFRGRFGTLARSAGAGEVVIGFPFRYWDRYQVGAEDPELAYFQVTHDAAAPVLFSEFGWQEQAAYPEVDLQAVVRVDGAGSFAGTGDEGAELRFTAGDDRDRPWQLFQQGSLFEARFSTVYQSGAFDAAQFLGLGWKTAPLVSAVLVGYEGEARILEEEVGR